RAAEVQYPCGDTARAARATAARATLAAIPSITPFGGDRSGAAPTSARQEPLLPVTALPSGSSRAAHQLDLRQRDGGVQQQQSDAGPPALAAAARRAAAAACATT